VGFIFAWAELAVIRTGGSIACMAYIFAQYAALIYPLGANSTLTYAIGSILALTILNAIGVRPGRFVQNALTVSNFVGLAGICLIALWCLVCHPAIPLEPVEARAPKDIEPVSLALMMVLVFYAYGGWNEAAFISSEVKNPKRNIRRALLIGTSLVMLLYIAVNLAYISALGFSFVSKTKVAAADMYAIAFGDAGRKGLYVLIMLSALGSVNGLLFTGMRLYGTFGADHKFFTWLAGKGGHHVAYGALFAQAAFSFLLILIVETAVHWRRILADIAPYFNMHLKEEFHKAGDIERIVTCTAPVFWVFFLLTGGSLFILRVKDPHRERPVRVPFYPVVPLIFCASCAFMLYRSGMWAFEQQPAEALIVAGLMLLGIPLCFLSGRAAKRAQEQEIGRAV
jgi:amino acid transporter